MSKGNHIVEDVAIVVLAAGTSSRLGIPKQLIRYNGKSLLQHTIDVALQTNMRPVVAVLGAHDEIIRGEVKGEDVIFVQNDQWREGMAASLRCGLAAVQKIKPGTDGIIFMVCDQPHVSSDLLNSLLSVQNKTGMPIVASAYNDTVGIPALFYTSYFDELMELKGDTGAKNLIRLHEAEVSTVLFPKGNIDIDTGDDYKALI